MELTFVIAVKDVSLHSCNVCDNLVDVNIDVSLCIYKTQACKLFLPHDRPFVRFDEAKSGNASLALATRHWKCGGAPIPSSPGPRQICH